MSTPELSVLECAILGLLQQEPRSGYDLMKMFADTAMGSFSGSPGTVYPAVTRLERRGLVRGTTQNAATLRPRRVFRPTPAGVAALERHLRSSVTRDDVVRDPGAVLLRFAFAGELLGAAAATRLLEEFAAAIEAYLPELRAQLAGLASPRQAYGRRALQRGIDGLESDLGWARRTAQEIHRQEGGAGRRARGVAAGRVVKPRGKP